MSARSLRFTGHAELMLKERGLERAWIVRALQAPLAVEADPVRPGRWRAFIRLPERDGRALRVVYETIGDEAVVITAFLDRGWSA